MAFGFELDSSITSYADVSVKSF